MVISVTDFRTFVTTDLSNTVLQMMLEGIESFVQKYTNNDFVSRETGLTVYPADIKMGVINLMKWELNTRDKVGISSESISRHSVSYFDQSTSNTVGGYPAALVGFLKPYMRARF